MLSKPILFRLNFNVYTVVLWNYSQGIQVFDARNFYPRCVNSANSMQGARLVNKGGKIGKRRNNQTSDQEYEKNCIVSERKGIKAVCVLTPRLFSHSTLSSRLGRKKMVIFFFVLLLRINFSFSSVEKVLNCPQRPRINCYSVAIRARQSGTVKTVEHSNNEYHECSKQGSKDWHSEDFDAK